MYLLDRFSLPYVEDMMRQQNQLRCIWFQHSSRQGWFDQYSDPPWSGRPHPPVRTPEKPAGQFKFGDPASMWRDMPCPDTRGSPYNWTKPASSSWPSRPPPPDRPALAPPLPPWQTSRAGHPAPTTQPSATQPRYNEPPIEQEQRRPCSEVKTPKQKTY